ncbi:MAG: hypothetical protein WBE74_03970, partial [Terracidiphilus sp.]
MNWFKSITGTAAEPQPGRELNSEPDGELEQALKNFRQSLHAWSEAEFRSEAEFNRPRTVRVAADSAWRPVLA